MKLLPRVVRRSIFTLLQKTVNLFVIFAFMLQPFGATGFNVKVLAADEPGATVVTPTVVAPAETPAPAQDAVTPPAPTETATVPPVTTAAVAPVTPSAPATQTAPSDTPTSLTTTPSNTSSAVSSTPADTSSNSTSVITPSNSNGADVTTTTPTTTNNTAVTSQETSADITPVTPPTGTTTITSPTDTTTPPSEITAPVVATPKTPAPVVETWGVQVGNKATTNSVVELGKVYVAPQNDQVTVTFTTLPANPGKLSIEEITLTEEQKVSLGALSYTAYDITSDMVDGTFAYDLTLPKVENNISGISYIEKSADELDGAKAEEVKKIDENKIDVESNTIKATGIDHFTIFVVTSLNTQAGCNAVLSGTTLGTTCFSKIQDAINAANLDNSGGTHTINVAAGTYTENLTIDESLSLIGAGDSTTINGGIDANGANVTIQDLKITNQNSKYNSGTFYYGVKATAGKLLTLENVTVDVLYYGVYMIGGSSTSGTAITINNSRIKGYAAIYLNGAGATNAVVSVSNTSLLGRIKSSGSSDDFAVIAVKFTSGVHINFTGTSSVVNEFIDGAQAKEHLMLFVGANAVAVTGTPTYTNAANSTVNAGALFFSSSAPYTNTVEGQVVARYVYNTSTFEAALADNSVTTPIVVGRYEGGYNSNTGVYSTPIVTTKDNTLNAGVTLIVEDHTPTTIGTGKTLVNNGTIIVETDATFNFASITKGGTSTLYPTIQSAVTDAQGGDTINVAAGTYNEFVTIDKSLTLNGAQAGVDARTVRVPGGPSESTIDGSGKIGVIWVNGVGITVKIDGFTLQSNSSISVTNNGLGGAITTSQSSGLTGLNVSNNIIQHASIGISPQGDSAVIEHNLIQNMDITGPSAGTGIYTDFGLTNSTIDSNKFINNPNAAIVVVVSGSGNTISNNETHGEIYLGGQTNAQVTGNTITNSSGNGIHLGGGNATMTISGNTITGNTQNGIKVSNEYSQGVNSGVVVYNNDIETNTVTGLTVDSDAHTGTLDATNNWWGSANGPKHSSNTFNVGLQGNTVSNNVDFVSWLNATPPTGVSFAPVTTSDPVDGKFSSIQAAVNGSNPGAIINVAAGTYNENVTINKTLTLNGAKHGVDARTRATGSESVINGTSPIGILADNVVIDGFTIQGSDNSGYIAGIWDNPGFSGTHGGFQILNNIIQNNVSGIGVGNDGTIQAQIKYNLIKNNNNSGPASGTGIYSDTGARLINTVIDNNTFDHNWVTLLGAQTVTISNNEITNASGLYLYDDSEMTVTGNNVHGNVDGISIAGGNHNVTISGNKLKDNSGQGIIVSNDGAGLNTNVSVHSNDIENNTLGGITVNTGTYTGTLDAINNWWGSASPSFDTIILGSVNHDPWYVNSGKTILSNAVTGDSVTPLGSADLILSSDIVGGVDLPVGVTDVILDNDSGLDLSAGLSVDNTVILQSGIKDAPIVLTNSDLSGVSASIPDGTKIQGPADWNGIIDAPHVVTSAGTAPSGFAVGNSIIEIGSSDGVLYFNQAVKITLPGVAGTVAYKPAGIDVWTEITTQCNSATDHSNISSGECSFSDGTDTVIWTYHFTSFGGLTDTQAPNNVKNLDATYKQSPDRVQLTWDVSDTDTYQVYLYRGKTKDFTVNTDSRINKNDRNDTNYSDYNVTPGEKYYYKVVAVDAAGNKSSASIISIALPTTGTNAVVKNEGTAVLPAGTVLGAETTNPSDTVTTPDTQTSGKTTTIDNSQNGKVLGADTTSTNGNNGGLALWQWLLFIFLLGGAGYYGVSYFRNNRNPLS